MGQSSLSKLAEESFEPLRSRKDEARALLKNSFKNPVFSLVPFEIWRSILNHSKARAIALLSQTCWGFKELVDDIGENNFNLALLFRKECQIRLAKKYLLLCANNNNSIAIFHVGYAYQYQGWRLKQNLPNSFDWFKKSAESGYEPGFAAYALCCRVPAPMTEEKVIDTAIENEWATKAFASKDNFVQGYCHYWGIAVKKDYKRGCEFFSLAAEEGNEFAQFWLGIIFQYGCGVAKDDEKAFGYYKASALQGLADSQYRLGLMRVEGHGCIKDEKLGISWLKKAANQGHDFAQRELKRLGVK